MDTKLRFNRDEISLILRRAAELEHKDNIKDDGDGLTLEEIQQVSKEVGIDPKFVRKALNDLNSSTPSQTSNILGGPFRYNATVITDEQVNGQLWEDVVAEIRRIHGGIGKTGKLGNTFEWEQRKREVGYIQIALAPKNDQTQISINANYTYHAIFIYAMSGFLGISLTGLALDGSTWPVLMQFTAGATGLSGSLALGRFYLSSWMKKKRQTYRKLIDRMQSLLGSKDANEQTSSLVITEYEVDENYPEHEAQQKKKIKE